MISQNGFKILPITQQHLENINNMPFHHRDPFDRIIVATAKAENMTILTVDEGIRRYDIKCVW